MKKIINIDDTLETLSGLEDFYFDLQLFAAEDEGRTEEPTEKKIKEARDKGQVAKSQELGQAVVVIAGFLMIFVLSSWIFRTFVIITKYYFTHFSKMQLTEKSILNDFFAITIESGKILLPIFLAASIAAIVGNIIQVGYQVTTEPLKFDFNKMKFDPATVIKKIFFSKQVAMNLFKSIFKVLAIGTIAYVIASADFGEILASPDYSVQMALKNILMSGLKIILWSSILLVILSVPDFIFQKKELMESLKMTKQEMKEELKESNGDPHQKAKMKEMQRDILMNSLIAEVPKADVVVTNPTHFACALKYNNEIMDAPVLVAKGVDSIALKIREIARENDVPIIENRPLAQQIYRDLEVGDLIPEELFQAVSYIYAELFKKKQYQKVI